MARVEKLSSYFSPFYQAMMFSIYISMNHLDFFTENWTPSPWNSAPRPMSTRRRRRRQRDHASRRQGRRDGAPSKVPGTSWWSKSRRPVLKAEPLTLNFRWPSIFSEKNCGNSSSFLKNHNGNCHDLPWFCHDFSISFTPSQKLLRLDVGRSTTRGHHTQAAAATLHVFLIKLHVLGRKQRS